MIARSPCILCLKAQEDQKPPEYRIWIGLRQRCNDQRYHGYDRYGGRGIRVCERWESFEAFLKDVGSRPSDEHSLDRIDNSGDYTPKNCRWATRNEQQRNKQDTFLVEAFGETRSVHDWADDLGITPQAIRYRLKKGWSPEDAVTILRGGGPNGNGGPRK